MRPLAAVLPLALLASGIAAPPPLASPLAGAPGRVSFPLVTPQPWILGEGSTEFGAEGAWIDHERPPFSDASAGSLDRTRATMLALASRGLGPRVEGSLRFGLQGSYGNDAAGHPQPTDVRLDLGYALDGREDTGVASAFHLLAKVPTAPDRHGAGTDEADLGFSLTSGARTHGSGIYGSTGLLLLGNPLRNGAQDDVVTYGLGGWLGPEDSLSVTMELEGQAFSRFHNSSGYLHVGVRRAYRRGSGEGIAGSLSFSRGIDGDSSRWGITAGLAWITRRSR
ncbi:MAG TPA: hypothetical protein VE404_10530 [Verrucomicrobiae bacterium]|nr:hypothetical protein [Verrucomicrobiae bacterium]